MKNEIRDMILFSVVCISLAAGWWAMWVHPRTLFLESVMDCMTEANDHSEEAYNTCAAKIKNY